MIFFLLAFAEHSDKLGHHTGLKFFLFCDMVVRYRYLRYFGADSAVVGALCSRCSWHRDQAHAGLLAPWAAKDLIIGLVTAAAIVGIEFAKVELPSFLRFGKETAKWSFSLYAIHYPMLVFFNVMSDNPHDSTMGAIGLDLTFTVPCLLLAVVFYFLFERHTEAVRTWIKYMWIKQVAIRRSPELLPDNLKLSEVTKKPDPEFANRRE